MEELQIERIPYQLWTNTGDLIVESCKPFQHATDMLELDKENQRDEQLLDSFYAVAHWMFNFGFMQGVAWAKGGCVE